MGGLANRLQGACKGLAKRLQGLLCVCESTFPMLGAGNCSRGTGASRHIPNLTASIKPWTVFVLGLETEHREDAEHYTKPKLNSGGPSLGDPVAAVVYKHL